MHFVLFSRRHAGVTKIPLRAILIMRWTAFFLLAAILQTSAAGHAQTITLSQRNAPLNRVFKEIKKQTGYNFLYTDEQLQQTRNVDVEVQNASLQETLELCFKHQPLTYSIINKTIIVKKKETPVKRLEVELSQPIITITGRVVNETGDPVVASILVKGTTNGTTSNADGYFELKGVDENATLLISSVNIEETVVVPVKGRTNLGIIVTKTRITTNEEVIVNTGYWTTTKQNSLGNIVKVDAKDIEKQPVTSLLMALQGRVPGMEIKPVNGVPGSAPRIEIRGINSLRNGSIFRDDGNLPLYVIDGVPIESTELTIGSGPSSATNLPNGLDPLSFLDPANIQSIEVLKDADATGIYGSRGANGVILITTKKGLRSSKGSFDLAVYSGVGSRVKKLPLLNRQQYLDMRREALANDGLPLTVQYGGDLTLWDTTRSTDWQDVLAGESVNVTDVQGGVSFGNSNTRFRFGAGYHKETTIYSDDFGFKRGTGSLSVNYLSDNKKLSANFLLNYGVSRNLTFEAGNSGYSIFLAPIAPELYNEDGSLNWKMRQSAPGVFTHTFTNPLATLLRTTTVNAGTMVSNASLGYKLLGNLEAKVNLGFSQTQEEDRYVNPAASYPPGSSLSVDGAFLQVGKSSRNTWIVEPQLLYSQKMGQHSIELLAGATWQSGNNKRLYQRGDGYVSDVFLNTLRGASLVRVLEDARSQYHYNAFFARVGYNWKQKYLLNLTARRDGSSKFGPNNRYGNFGSVAAGWIFSRERLFENSRVLSFGKIRTSYGVTGNDQIPENQYYDTYSFGDGYLAVTSITPTALFNPDFQWEETKKFEVGLQLGFLKDRINVDLSYYHNRSSNQLVQYSLPAATGFSAVLRNFPAVVGNEGWELILNASIIRSKKVSWSSSFNIATNNNKLIAYPGIENSSFATIYKVGEPLNIKRFHKWTGVNTQTGLHEVEDLNKDGFINDNDWVFHAMATGFYGGLTNSVQYKNLELSFLFQFAKRQGEKSLAIRPGEATNIHTLNLRRWQKPGDITDVQRFATSYNTNASTAMFYALNSDLTIEDASFISLKTVSVSYTLSGTFINKLKITGAKCFIQAQNLFVITNSVNMDPETGNLLPPLRMINAGIQLRL